jgi:hypothetical protein
MRYSRVSRRCSTMDNLSKDYHSEYHSSPVVKESCAGLRQGQNNPRVEKHAAYVFASGIEQNLSTPRNLAADRSPAFSERSSRIRRGRRVQCMGILSLLHGSNLLVTGIASPPPRRPDAFKRPQHSPAIVALSTIEHALNVGKLPGLFLRLINGTAALCSLFPYG